MAVLPFRHRPIDFSGRAAAPAVEAPAAPAFISSRGGFAEIKVRDLVIWAPRIVIALPGEWDVLAQPEVIHPVKHYPQRVFYHTHQDWRWGITSKGVGILSPRRQKILWWLSALWDMDVCPQGFRSREPTPGEKEKLDNLRLAWNRRIFRINEEHWL